MSENARDLLAQADRQRRIAEGAESVRRGFRLGLKPAVKKGLFGLRQFGKEEFRPVGTYESMALYQAAAIVRRDALAAAEALEARVTTQEQS